MLQPQVADREANGDPLRIEGAHFPQVKTLEDFTTDHQPSLHRDIRTHLATTSWIAKAETVVHLRPPSVGKTHLAIGLGIKVSQADYSVLFDTATNQARSSAPRTCPSAGRARSPPTTSSQPPRARRPRHINPLRPIKKTTKGLNIHTTIERQFASTVDRPGGMFT